MSNKSKEYEMLRQEILQYLGEYQSVRNMMYLVTATILGFSLNAESTNIYLYLLPLIVILPSYIISIDYWKCITKVGTYLIVFHERDRECPFKWETCHRKFNEKCRTISQSDCQEIPYVVCASICLLLYFGNINYKIKCHVEFIIGCVVLFICIAVFLKHMKIDFEKFIGYWEDVKDDESKEDTKKVNVDKGGK